MKDAIFINFFVIGVFLVEHMCKRHGLQVKKPQKNEVRKKLKKKWKKKREKKKKKGNSTRESI